MPGLGIGSVPAPLLIFCVSFEITNNLMMSTMQGTEGWERGLGISGLKYFFSENGFRGFLGSHWKIFHHGTLRNHFQVLVVLFGSQPGGEKRGEVG